VCEPAANHDRDPESCGACGHACGGGACVASARESPQFLAVDATSVYWTDSVSGTVMKCAISGCGTAPTLLASGKEPWRVAAGAAAVYWTDFTSGTVEESAR